MTRIKVDTTIEKTTAWNTNLSVGDQLEGTYISVEHFQSTKYVDKEVTKYVIEGADGIKYGVYGSASLNRQFAKVPVGSHVWITYDGETTSKNGFKVKLYTVEYEA